MVYQNYAARGKKKVSKVQIMEGNLTDGNAKVPS